jgi:hypothetical protein
MRKKANRQPRQGSPVARSLRLSTAAPRIVQPKKGNGSYPRTRCARAPGAAADLDWNDFCGGAITRLTPSTKPV